MLLIHLLSINKLNLSINIPSFWNTALREANFSKFTFLYSSSSVTTLGSPETGDNALISMYTNHSIVISKKEELLFLLSWVLLSIGVNINLVSLLLSQKFKHISTL